MTQSCPKRDKQRTEAKCPCSKCTQFPFSEFQTLSVPSRDPDTINLPSSANSTHLTVEVCPSKSNNLSPVQSDQMIKVRSVDPVTKMPFFQSTFKAQTPPKCPTNVKTARPFWAFQRRAVPSSEPVTMNLPTGSISMQVITWLPWQSKPIGAERGEADDQFCSKIRSNLKVSCAAWICGLIGAEICCCCWDDWFTVDWTWRDIWIRVLLRSCPATMVDWIVVEIEVDEATLVLALALSLAKREAKISLWKRSAGSLNFPINFSFSKTPLQIRSSVQMPCHQRRLERDKRISVEGSSSLSTLLTSSGGSFSSPTLAGTAWTRERKKFISEALRLQRRTSFLRSRVRSEVERLLISVSKRSTAGRGGGEGGDEA